MDAENKEVQSATDASTPIENHNSNKIRRRNVPIELANYAIKEDNLCDRVPLVILPDSTKAWYNGSAPRIPDVTDAATSGKQQNGVVLTHEDDRESNGNASMDPVINRERMKISVIRGSIANPDLTLGELRLLGCSSEGFVNGTLSR